MPSHITLWVSRNYFKQDRRRRHSLSKLFAGLADAAFVHCMLIVATAIKITLTPTMMNVQAEMLSL